MVSRESLVNYKKDWSSFTWNLRCPDSILDPCLGLLEEHVQLLCYLNLWKVNLCAKTSPPWHMSTRGKILGVIFQCFTGFWLFTILDAIRSESLMIQTWPAKTSNLNCKEIIILISFLHFFSIILRLLQTRQDQEVSKAFQPQPASCEYCLVHDHLCY